jgi:hypothetical protein
VDTYRIYDGTDENGIVGTVAPAAIRLPSNRLCSYEPSSSDEVPLTEMG